MAFGFAGAAAGASDALQALLQQAFLRQQQEQQMALQQRSADRADASAAQQVRAFEADEAFRSQQLTRQAQQDDIAAADRRQGQNKQGVQRMMGDFLMQRGSTPLDQGARNQLMGMGLSEGIDVPASVTTDPGQAQRERVELENLRSKNDLEIEAARGRNTLAAATARTAGTRDASTQRRIDSTAKGFDSQPTVRRAQLLAESAQFAQSLNPNTTNPADDQALIYNFAKSMDPDSAVREGEYATVQKYAQSLAERFGFNAARVFSNTPFLTPEARQNLKASILERYKAARGGYDSLRKSYVDKLGGMGGDEADLIDYGAGFPQMDVPPPAGGASKFTIIGVK